MATGRRAARRHSVTSINLVPGSFEMSPDHGRRRVHTFWRSPTTMGRRRDGQRVRRDRQRLHRRYDGTLRRHAVILLDRRLRSAVRRRAVVERECGSQHDRVPDWRRTDGARTIDSSRRCRRMRPVVVYRTIRWPGDATSIDSTRSRQQRAPRARTWTVTCRVEWASSRIVPNPRDAVGILFNLPGTQDVRVSILDATARGPDVRVGWNVAGRIAELDLKTRPGAGWVGVYPYRLEPAGRSSAEDHVIQ